MRALLILVLLVAWRTAALAQEGGQVQIPRLSANVDPNETYIHALLTLGLKKSGKAYQLVQEPRKMQQARSITELANPHGTLDLLWSMPTDARETQMIPIRIPIEKGLMGWRIPLVRADRAEMFAQVKTLKDLQALTAGQEFDWPDVPILRGNGIATITAASYEGLFDMLGAGRFDYFPRSVFEVWNELDAHPSQRLVADRHIVLHYQAPYYFFVARRRPRLAEDLLRGLEAAVKDGSFDKLFEEHNRSAIQKADIRNRVVIELANPVLHLDRQTAQRAELWFQP